MDLSKTFDFIPHGLLVLKIVNLCPDIKQDDFKEYKSQMKEILKGISHSSSLGPFIFNAFMNDIFYFIETCDLTNYVDDNTLHHITSTIEAVRSALRKYTKHTWRPIALGQPCMNWVCY